jgi:hypothetical protein
MDIGELTEVTVPDQTTDEQCPFSHEKPNPKEKNELGGIGSTLGSNMAHAKGVHTSKPPVGPDYTTGEADPDPRDRRGTSRVRPIVIEVNGERVRLNGKNALAYPLTCAAHHLIPAQESLKKCIPILKFMCKDAEPQDFRNSGAAATVPVDGGTLVWGNVAYNVNGSHNGVWLPGNYAVGAGVGGVEVWKNKASDKRKTYTDQVAAENWIKALDLGPDDWALYVDPKEEEGPQPGGSFARALCTASKKEFMLAGKNYHIDNGNPKWAYVKAAMDTTCSQFHDRHETYSAEVEKYLKKIAAPYRQMYDRSLKPETACNKCKKARVPAGAKESLVGPPYGIVSRLVAASNFFKQYVATQVLTAKNIYTSKWVKAWMDTKK